MEGYVSFFLFYQHTTSHTSSFPCKHFQRPHRFNFEPFLRVFFRQNPLIFFQKSTPEIPSPINEYLHLSTFLAQNTLPPKEIKQLREYTIFLRKFFSNFPKLRIKVIIPLVGT
ncbi:hypothetical protein ACH5RR_025411 [Cinchona calisaya]|uniref:Maturase K n=1 Tax=Cinchona calisaya TaxID=153742 RepID=A0ABD2Z205_9GENT